MIPTSTILLQTCPADAVEYDVFGFYPPQPPDIFRQAGAVERLPKKIDHLFAAFTDKMVVLHHFRLKASLAFAGLDPLDQVMSFKGV